MILLYGKVDKYGNKILSYDKVKKTLWYKENQRWARWIKEQGYDIYDLGDNPGMFKTAPDRSAFYDIEKIEIFNDITYDDIINGQKTTIKLEMKNWNGFFHKAMAGQFVKDLMNMEVLGEIVWVFNQKGANSKLEYLKGNVMKALRKADGTPIDELQILFKGDHTETTEYFTNVFGRNIQSADDLIRTIEEPIIFSQLFKLSQ